MSNLIYLGNKTARNTKDYFEGRWTEIDFKRLEILKNNDKFRTFQEGNSGAVVI